MDAFVELELKGKIGRPNVIIKRCFQRKNKSSVWTINGMCPKRVSRESKADQRVGALR